MAKTYTSVPNVATGDVYTASTYNTMTAQNINNLRVPSGCRAVRTSNATFSGGSYVSFESVSVANLSFDTDSMWTVSDPTKITANTTGLYVVGACMDAYSTSSTGGAILGLQLQLELGAAGNIICFQMASGYNGNVGSAAVLHAIVALTAGDYIRLRYYSNGGTGTNLVIRGNSGSTSGPPASMWATWIGQVS